MKVPIYRIAKFVSYIFLTGVVAVSFLQFEFVHVSTNVRYKLQEILANSNSATYIMPSGKRIPCEITPLRNLNDLT